MTSISKNQTRKVINQRSVRVTKSNHRIKKQQSTNIIHTTIHSLDRTLVKKNNNSFSVRLSDSGIDVFYFIFVSIVFKNFGY